MAFCWVIGSALYALYVSIDVVYYASLYPSILLLMVPPSSVLLFLTVTTVSSSSDYVFSRVIKVPID